MKKKIIFLSQYIYMENHITHANPPFCRKKKLILLIFNLYKKKNNSRRIIFPQKISYKEK